MLPSLAVFIPNLPLSRFSRLRKLVDFDKKIADLLKDESSRCVFPHQRFALPTLCPCSITLFAPPDWALRPHDDDDVCSLLQACGGDYDLLQLIQSVGGA